MTRSLTIYISYTMFNKYLNNFIEEYIVHDQYVGKGYIT